MNSPDKEKSKTKEAEPIFSEQLRMSLIHQVIVAEQSANRSGTKAQKNRSAVRGGGAKPWKQKGTGRARAGTSRSPIWRSGGVTFAAETRDYAQKINRKMFKGAMRSTLAELERQGVIVVCEKISLEQPKTKLLMHKLEELKVSDVLIISVGVDENLNLASRNVHAVGVVDANQVCVSNLLEYKNLVITVDALDVLKERVAA